MPCYTEDLKIVAETVSAAVEADVPPNSTLTVCALLARLHSCPAPLNSGAGNVHLKM